MLIEKWAINILRGAKENYARPAIDPMFRSAAISHQPSAIATEQ
ncbi:hypothetical protein HU731_026795 [Pseudomonas salmasensis]|nr:hypothetical protein HU731_026795 [Pseudomonas salmasensis]